MKEFIFFDLSLVIINSKVHYNNYDEPIKLFITITVVLTLYSSSERCTLLSSAEQIQTEQLQMLEKIRCAKWESSTQSHWFCGWCSVTEVMTEATGDKCLAINPSTVVTSIAQCGGASFLKSMSPWFHSQLNCDYHLCFLSF